MLEFEDALDGQYDAATQLQTYFSRRAAPSFRETADRKRSITSREAFERRRASVRETVVSQMGGLPSVPTEPSVETTGRVEGDGYTIQQVVVETWENHHVTTNCYVPAGEGPFPAVLFLCGHVENPKSDEYNQRACQELAANGFVVTIVDPLCQGERTQYLGPDGEPTLSGGGGVFAHCFAGQRAFHAGSTLARYMIHDDRCVLSALLARPDVDSDRVAVAGASGGGTQAGYLMLVDDRLDAGLVCCCTTTRRDWLASGQRIDAEQLVVGAIPAGIDYDDFLTGITPAPVCVGAAVSDRYFHIEGTSDAVERARRVYELYDAGDNVGYQTAETTHCSVWEIGSEVFRFLCEAVGEGSYEPRDDYEVRDTETLRCTPTGRVLDAYPSERTIGDLLRADLDEQTATAPDALRDRVIETLSLDRDGCEPRVRLLDASPPDGLAAQRLWFKTERNPDAVVAGVLVTDAPAESATAQTGMPDLTAANPAVVCFEDGTAGLDDRTAELRSLVAEYGTVLVFDPRGVGATRNRRVPIHGWIEEYDSIYGTAFKLAYDALLLDTSLVGLRVFDVLQAVRVLRAETDASGVSFVGEKTGAIHALYAAAVADDVATVELRELGGSFRERTTDPELSFQPGLAVYDVIGQCDVDQTVAGLEDRGVTVTRH